MQFYEILEQLIDKSGCTAKEIAKSAGISESTLSRYRKGERLPEADMAERIFFGIAHAASRNGSALPEQAYDTLMHTLDDTKFSSERFSYLLTEFSVNLTKLASYVNYTPSYLSRIRLGKCSPSDTERFLHGLCAFFQAETEPAHLEAVFGKADSTKFPEILRQYLWNKMPPKKESTDKFLTDLDQFDLNAYMSEFRFEDLMIPKKEKIPVYSCEYIGTEQMRKAELEFFRLTLLSESEEEIFIHDELPFMELAQDVEFDQQWVQTVAKCLKRGLHMNLVHTLDRPSEELIHGLKIWIPLYMTGGISPYYLKKSEKNLFQNAVYLSGSAAMTGVSVRKGNGYYSLSTEQNKISVIKAQAAQILKASSPMMQIFTEANTQYFYESIWPEAFHKSKRTAILSTPPLHTISAELLSSILTRNGIPETEQERFLNMAQTVKAHTDMILQESEIIDIIPDISEEEFHQQPLCLPLTECFCENRYQYTYQEYQEHLAQTRAYQEKYKNYTLILKHKILFRNIRIISQNHNSVMISKSNAPVVHFVIRHPKLVRAIEESCMKEYI